MMNLMFKGGLVLLSLGLLSCSTEPVPPKPVDRPVTPERVPQPGLPASNVRAPQFPAAPIDYRPQRGYASLYSLPEHGSLTYSGEPYDLYSMTAAHPRWPMNTYIRVHYGKRQALARINDRNRDGTALRLSYQVARDLGLSSGTEVTYQALGTPTKTVKQRQDLKTMSMLSNNPVSYYIQAGAFNSLQNAQQLGQYLRSQLSQTVRILKGSNMYRVHIGPLPNGQARDLLNQLPSYGVESGFLIPVQATQIH